jgi:hypothetical protein
MAEDERTDTNSVEWYWVVLVSAVTSCLAIGGVAALLSLFTE